MTCIAVLALSLLAQPSAASDKPVDFSPDVLSCITAVAGAYRAVGRDPRTIYVEDCVALLKLLGNAVESVGRLRESGLPGSGIGSPFRWHTTTFIVMSRKELDCLASLQLKPARMYRFFSKECRVEAVP